METQSRKRTRVADYNYDDEVTERSAKRIKQEPKIKQEIKKEAEIKQESMAPIKKESKVAIKSEIKSEVKIELKKEKIEKNVKLEPKTEIKQENDHTEEATDQADENLDEEIDLNERSNEQNQEKGPNAIEISDDEEGNEEDEEDDEDEGEENTALRIGDCPDKYNFAEFKTIVLTAHKPRWSNAIDQPQALFNTKVIETILSFSSLPAVLIWMQVSKSTSNLAYDQSLWQILFRKQHWRLPHEIRNHNFRPVIQLDISDKQVDWYKEYKRNYNMRCEVRKVIDTIVRIDNDEPNEKFKVSDEVISAWEKKTDYFLPNELREFYKYSPDAYSIPEIDELYVCTDEVSLFSLYRVKVDEEDDDDEEGEPDVRSIAKLLDIPMSRVDRDFAGILYIINHGRQGDFVFVPYVNRFYLICSTNSGEGVYFCQESTLVQRLEEFQKRFVARHK